MAAYGDEDVLVVDEADSAAVAAAMGFAQFGMQGGPPAKRRRFHQQAGVAVAAAPAPPPATGANTAAVLPPRPRPAPATATNAACLPANADEIDLDEDDEDEDDEDDEGGVGVADGDEPLPQPASRQDGVADTLGADPDDAAEVDHQLDGSAHSTGRSPHRHQHHHHQRQHSHHSHQHLHHLNLHPHLIAQRPDRHGFRPGLMPGSGDQGDGLAGTPGVDVGGGEKEEGAQRPAAGAVGPASLPARPPAPNPANPTASRLWWSDYYDPSSNANPWAQLETERGLAPCGQWLAQGHAHPVVGPNQQGGGRRGSGHGHGQQGPRR